MRNHGFSLLAAWLIAGGLIPLLQISFTGRDTVLAVLGGMAGFMLLVESRGVRWNWAANIECKLLGIWVISASLFTIPAFAFAGASTLLAVLGIITGILLLRRC